MNNTHRYYASHQLPKSQAQAVDNNIGETHETTQIQNQNKNGKRELPLHRAVSVGMARINVCSRAHKRALYRTC